MGGLWRHRPFLLLWTGQTVSQLGSQVTLVALPLTAILFLGATPTQVGVLFAAGYLPAAAVGLFAGVLVDRLHRQPLLIVCQTLQGLVTLTVPLAAWFSTLTFEQLIAVQALNGALMVVSTSAGLAFLPGLVGTRHLTEANARLSISSSITRVAGPAFAGLLVQLLSAPVAILADAISFVFSAGCVAAIEIAEAAPVHIKRSVRADITEGIYLVLGHRLLRPLVLALGTYNFFAAMFTAIYSLYMVRDLGLSPLALGIIFACGGIGGILGGLSAERLNQRFGTGKSIVGGTVLLATMHLVAPLAAGPALFAGVLLAGAGILAQFGAALLEVNTTTLTQQLVPSHALGRVSATRQVVALALVPIGAAFGGIIGDAVGLRAAIGIGAVGTTLAALTLLRSPVWSAAAPPEIADERPSRESTPHDGTSRASGMLRPLRAQVPANARR
jgi:MFS family permease